MNTRCALRLALALTLATPAVAMMGALPGFAQAPAPPASPPAGAAETPATPAPAAPPAAQAPAPVPGAPAQSGDPFGADVTLSARSVIALKGTANWDTAFETLTEALKTMTTFLDKQGIKPAGAPLIVYTSTDDTGFTFQAQIPVDDTPKNLPKNLTMTKSPEGKVLKFVHRGSYDNMDNTYEAITNHLDDKQIEAQDTFIEEYVTDPLKTAEDKLIINVFVPLK